ncbi:hypothetical protein BO86DRAFT_384143 [Aspergillus japonicus CBS 114.51]|uniref:Uncharacterized protein n=1 Tax=Aspergillus japonicus CBS 114.51 TaxID=1448312 RepID=A0A8T8WKS0_ASPJA|nr:hypothetical protein BO86DRAFT_384143 [Aspergillus japonicus CBS 114.51]RAH76090.1 hypothetical protein BO86DRAFT_384143 [Aspergillus japonicus CBS 114.51]
MECYGLTRTPHYGYEAYRHQNSSPRSTWESLIRGYFPPHEGFVIKTGSPEPVHSAQAHGGQYEGRGYDWLTVHSAGTGTHLTLIGGHSAFKGTDWPYLLSMWPHNDARHPRFSFAGIVQGDWVRFYVHHPQYGFWALGLRGLGAKSAFDNRTDASWIHQFLAQFRLFARTPERICETSLQEFGLPYNRLSADGRWRALADYCLPQRAMTF